MGTADWRLAVDIGGTFTDLVLLDAASGTVVVDKTLTTPSAPLEAVRSRSVLLKISIGCSFDQRRGEFAQKRFSQCGG